MRLLAFAFSLLLALPAQAAELVIGSWNLAWLTLRPADDPALPGNVMPRQAGDFARLRAHGEALRADIVALQEIDGEPAAARVFPPDQWRIVLTQENDVQRAGFAIRRGLRFSVNPDLAGLDLNPDARFSLRKGSDITVQLPDNGGLLRLLSVHLKAGCSAGRLDGESRDCEQLARQIPPLAGWIAQRRREGVPFMVLGDFNRHLSPRDRMLQMLEEAAPLLHVNAGRMNPCWARDERGRPYIDHFLAGGAARGWVRADSFRPVPFTTQDFAQRAKLSDHCPILVTLRTP